MGTVKTSTTQRSLARLRKDGWTCAIVEHWNSHTRTRHDLYGFADILAVNAIANAPFVLVQTTSGANVAARIAKITNEPRAREWLLCGGKIIVHGWRKVGARGKRKLWECREQEITLQMFAAQETAA
jgi:hypothetical protein